MKYSYQEQAAIEVLNNALNNEYLAGVLAGCPSSGKTTILIGIINLYLSNNNKQVLVITHNQNILKQQMLDSFSNPNIPVKFNFGVTQSNQVIVTTMASVHKYDLTNVGLIAIDEAHEYYLEKMHLNIESEARQVLMTGSPSFFNAYNKYTNGKKYGMYYIAGKELIEKDIFSGVELDTFIAKEDLRKTIDELLSFAAMKGYNLTKPMVAASNIAQARALSYYLKGYGYSVALSTSEDDKDNEEIQAFKRGDKNCLIVVNKGILGFSENSITSLIDFKASSDIDVRNQLFARILRVHKDDIKKSYISVIDKETDYVSEVEIMNELLRLMDKNYFSTYTGKYVKA